MQKILAITMTAAAAAAGALAAAGPGAQHAEAARLASPTVNVPCSVPALAAAITAATRGTTLNLPAHCTYDLTRALPAIRVRLTISGRRSTTTIERSTAPGTRHFSILTVIQDANLTVSNTNISNGDSEYGGGISGGFGTVTVEGGTFSGNNASNGGAIFSIGPLRVIHTVFTGNSAHIGGAVFVQENSDATITGAIFTGNSASDEGGAVYDEGGATVVGGTVSGNTSADEGGGIANQGVLGVTRTRFAGNSATYGGGIWNALELWVSGARFAGNSAAEGGGVLSLEGNATISKTAFRRNSASRYGGAIENLSNAGPIENLSASLIGAALNLNSSTLRGNSAGLGGGVANLAEGPNTASVTISTSRIAGNRARMAGGGIYNQPGSTVITLHLSKVIKNQPDNCAPVHTIAGCTQ